MNDLAIRAVKTFVQAFFGVLLPELVVFFQADFPVDVSTAALLFAPMLCASLSAGFSALGNFLYSVVSPEKKMDIEDVCFGVVDFHDPEFRQVVYRLTATLLDSFPEDSDELPSETIPLNNFSAERDVESTSCAE